MLNTEQPIRSRSLPAILLRWILLMILALGVLMGSVLAWQAVSQARTAIDQQGRQLLLMVQDSVRQAMLDQDLPIANRVVQGLFKHPAVHVVRMQQADGEVLSELASPLLNTSWRLLTDPLLGMEQAFSLELVDDQARSLGQMLVILDTGPQGQALVTRMGALISTGLICVLCLMLLCYLVLQRLLARPLHRLLQEMQQIDPEFPGRYQLSIARVHRGTELGRWVARTNLLLAAIEHNVQRRRQAEESLLRMSHVDALTSLPNRQGLQTQLDRILLQAEDDGSMVAVLCLGLDGFKQINEEHSFQQGDWVLRQLAQRIGSLLGDELASLARLGGDQFVLVQDRVVNPYQTSELAQKVLFMLQQPFMLNKSQGNEEISLLLSATLGIALYPRDADTSELLLQKAEHTLQLAKQGTRNRYAFYEASIDSQWRLRRQLEESLGKAIENQQLHVLYQPQICYASGRLVGAEALLRWHHPEHGWIGPEQFIPIAEQSGSILAIGEWVLEQVCQQLARWQAGDNCQLRIAVNLSAVQLHHRGLDQMLARLLSSYGIAAARLELEVTETSLMHNVDVARQQLLALRELGVGISVDDFGTGHSSLAYLKRLPLDKIKIDRSFVQDVLVSEDDATIVRTVIQLGHNLGLKVLAEGVETEQQQERLIEWRCDEGQGYLYSRPLGADELTRLVQKHQVAAQATHKEIL